MSWTSRRGALASITSLALALLLIEFLDELVWGANEAAWPLIRDDLGLTYLQISILLSLPHIIGNLVELSLGILADVWRRRVLILGGGVLFAAALTLAALSQGFWPLLIALILLSPSSGAFVSLSQAALMDADPDSRELNMARWTLAGSIGVVLGPLALGTAAVLGLGWRGLFLVFVFVTLLVLGRAWRLPPQAVSKQNSHSSFRQGLADALRALSRREVLRWLTLLEFSDLMLDVLLGFLALYFVDIVNISPAGASLAVAVWSGAGLVGDALLIPLLERVPGLRYLWWSAAAELVLFVGFLLAPGFLAKLILLGALGLLSAGWYSIPKAQLYSAMPEQSGTVMTVGNIFGLVSSLIPLGLGFVAENSSLGAAMWLLLMGPVALLIGIPRVQTRLPGSSNL